MSNSEDIVTKNIEKVNKLIAMFPDGRREKVNEMMNQVGEEYFLAPASTRESFHNAFPGGLCAHSLNVVGNLWMLQKSICPDKWPKHKLAFVGLFHDLGKVGVDEQKRYVPNENKFQRTEWGKIYKTNESMPYMTTSDGSLYTLQKYGINLDYEEWLAIKLNDGQYDPSNKEYMMKEPDLALLLHWADLWTTKSEKEAA